MPERPVPPHDHTRFSRGGKLSSSAITGLTTSTSGTGGGSDGGTGVSVHADLDGLSADDHSAYVTVILGGAETVSTVAATGASETVDLASGNVHDLTLTADCTLTLTGATASVACSVTILLRQDGTGGWLVTWPGSVAWPGAVTPILSTDPDTVDVFMLFTLDGGTVWFGFHASSGSSGSVASLDDLTDVVITNPEAGSRLRYDGASWIDSMSFPEILISDTPSTPLIFADLLQNESEDDLLYADP